MEESDELEVVEIFKGHVLGDPRPRWFVNQRYEDGSEAIVDDKLTHAEAWISALEGGVHVVDLSRPIFPLT